MTGLIKTFVLRILNDLTGETVVDFEACSQFIRKIVYGNGDIEEVLIQLPSLDDIK